MILKCLSCCVLQARIFVQEANKVYTIDNSPANKVLGIEFKSAKTSVIEMTDHLIDTGYIVKGGNKK